MSAYNNVIQGKYTALASAVRTATQIIVGQDLMDPQVNGNRSGINAEASGLIAYLNVTAAPGVETLTLVLEEQDPVSGVWSQITATSATTATGMVKLKIKPAIAAAAATTTYVAVQDVLPANWRIRVVHSASGNWTYSLGVVAYA